MLRRREKCLLSVIRIVGGTEELETCHTMTQQNENSATAAGVKERGIRYSPERTQKKKRAAAYVQSERARAVQVLIAMYPNEGVPTLI